MPQWSMKTLILKAGYNIDLPVLFNSKVDYQPNLLVKKVEFQRR
jgi:hypothetical protein